LQALLAYFKSATCTFFVVLLKSDLYDKGTQIQLPPFNLNRSLNIELRKLMQPAWFTILFPNSNIISWTGSYLFE